MRTFIESITKIEDEAHIFLCAYLKGKKNSEQLLNEGTLNKFGDYTDSLHTVFHNTERYTLDKIVYKEGFVVGMSNNEEIELFRKDIVYFASLIQEYL